jgi:drug/metabolite transporter (DMT)-like permease
MTTASPLTETPTPPPAGAGSRRLFQGGDGSFAGAFGATEWTLLTLNSLIWGSSFLWIDLGIESFRPGVVALSRVLLGMACLAVFRRARAPVERQDLPRIALLGVIWLALPMLLFPIAQQWIASSLAGMINGAVPLFAAAWSVVLLRRLPGRRQLVGLAVGFLGVAVISWPQMRGADATLLGVGLVVLATTLYGLASNLAVPLQQRYGALPVLLRAQLAALVILLPFGLWSLPGSSWSPAAALAMLPLGMLSTGLAYVLMTTLVGRVGAARGSVATYFIPVVAILLGVGVLGEELAPTAVAGTALVLAGAWLASRAER